MKWCIHLCGGWEIGDKLQEILPVLHRMYLGFNFTATFKPQAQSQDDLTDFQQGSCHTEYELQYSNLYEQNRWFGQLLSLFLSKTTSISKLHSFTYTYPFVLLRPHHKAAEEVYSMKKLLFSLWYISDLNSYSEIPDGPHSWPCGRWS